MELFGYLQRPYGRAQSDLCAGPFGFRLQGDPGLLYRGKRASFKICEKRIEIRPLPWYDGGEKDEKKR